MNRSKTGYEASVNRARTTPARSLKRLPKQFDEKVDSIDFEMKPVPESKESQIRELYTELGTLKQSIDEMLG